VLASLLKSRIRYVDLKGYLISSVFVAVGTVTFLVPALKSVENLTPLEALVNCTYIALDIVLIPLIVPLFMLYFKKPMGFVYGGFLLSATFLLMGDIIYNYYVIWGIYYTGSLPDVFYNLSYLVLLVTMFEAYKRKVRIVTIDDLEREKRKIELLNKLMRHDILNDLSAILGYLEIYGETRDPELLSKIRMRVENSINLIRAIRAIERKAELKPVNLRSVVLKEVSDVNADIRIDVPELKVLADELLSSVVRNLVINAIIHNDEKKPEISISAKEEDGWVELKIADNGPGIPDEMKEKVFEEGMGSHMGLGLFLVKSIVESYGGRIWIEDNEPKGAVFVVKLRSAQSGTQRLITTSAMSAE